MKRRRIVIILLLLLLIVGILGIIWGNSSLVTTEYTISSPALPDAFRGLRIVQLSDLHNAEFGTDNRRLLEAVSAAEPDLIFLTGDLLDSRRTDAAIALEFVREVIKIAPVYYSLGNHEGRIPEIYEPFEEELRKLGVQVLRNEVAVLEREGQQLYIAGIDDPEFFPSQEAFLECLNELCHDDGYTLLLSHRPELFAEYCDAGAELVFSGHAHGGQFRLPWVGGLYAPHQGALPEYDAGLFSQDGTSLIVSRGLGNSIFPFRLFNRPEIVVALLSTES